MALYDKASLVLIPSQYKEGKLYNIKPLKDSFEFERGSAATRVNSDGLIEQVGVSSTELWHDDNVFTNGTATYSNGIITFTASTNNDYILFQDLEGVEQGNYYEISFDTVVNSGSFSLLQGTGSSFVPNYLVNETGSYKRIVQYTHATPYQILFWSSNSGSLGAQFDGTISNISIKKVNLDTPRLDYSGTEPSLLLEPQRTNLVTYSEDFSQWSLGTGGISIDTGYLAPDGSNNATKVTMDSNFSTTALSLNIGLGTTETRAIYARTVSGTGQAHLCSFNGNTDNLFTITEEWQRFEVNGAISTGATNFYAVDFRGSTDLNEIIIWGAQSEQGSYATSYIPTNGQTETRLADVCQGAGDESTFNDSEGVLYAEVKFDNESNYEQISIGDGSNSMFVSLGKSNNQGDNAFYIRAYDGTAFQGPNQVLSGYSSLENNKIAFQYGTSLSDYKIYINGNEIDYTFSGTVPTLVGFDRLSFTQGSVSPTYGNVKMVAYFPEALTDTELQELTSNT